MKRFEYICLHNTDNGFEIDSFTLFAEIISRSEETVTYIRYMRFGNLRFEEPVTVPVTTFNKYYRYMTNEMYDECIKKENYL